MRTTSLLNVGPPITGGATGCNTARCRAATSTRTKADARMMRRMSAGATSYARTHSLLFVTRFDDPAVIRNLAVDDRQHALRVRQCVGRNAEDVLRQHRNVRELAGGDRPLFVF